MRLEDSAATDKKLHLAVSTRCQAHSASPLSASLAFCWRAILKIKHTPEQMLDVTATPIMFLLLFTYLFGGAMFDSTSDYLQYLLPGLLVMNVLFITIYTGLGINNDIKKGVFDRFRSLPVWPPAFLIGALLADTVRYTIAAILMLLLGLIMGFRPDGGAIGVLMAILLLLIFSFGLSWAWIALGLVTRTPESFMMTSMFILFPVTFISNVLVESETMPGWLQAIVDVNPITFMANASRGLMHNDVEAWDVLWVLVSSVLLVVLFAPLTMYFYRRKS